MTDLHTVKVVIREDKAGLIMEREVGETQVPEILGQIKLDR